MKVTPFTRDLLKAYREEKAKDTFDIEAIKAARDTLKANEIDNPRRPWFVTKAQAERLGLAGPSIEVIRPLPLRVKH